MPSKAASKASASKQRPGRYGRRRALLQLALTGALVSGIAAASAGSGVKEPPALKIIAFGDSLTAGYDLPASDAFPAVLEQALRAEGYHVTIINAGVSGDTASGGLARLEWTIADGADGVILELGANDMLRGIEPEVTKPVLDAILAKLNERHIKVLIAGMRATPSFGKDYKARFDAIYSALAEKYHAPLYPFFLDGVMGERALTLKDGLHPNSAGVQRIVKGILPQARGFLDELSRKAAQNE
jgi:acyl-CoA thioesterase-1